MTAIQKPISPIPEVLIYEVMDGEPVYYKGYREVLLGKKSCEDIMGASGLQSIIVEYLMYLLYTNFGRAKYRFFTNENGLHLDKRNNLSGDINIFKKDSLLPTDITAEYVKKPPFIGIEIDVKADLSRDRDANYVMNKTQKLLDFGVEKVIWIFTANKKIMIAHPQTDWLTTDWANDIELMENITFNIPQFLKEEGINH